MYTLNKYGMKVAVLLQGEPRFCAEFDQFLENLSEYDSVDYFICTWKNSDVDGRILASQGHRIVPPSWQNIDYNWAIEKFKELLPAGHQVINLDLIDQNSIQKEPITNNAAVETVQSNVWKMFYSLFKANEAKKEHETKNGFTYDLVIRARPDVALTNVINLRAIRDDLNTRPSIMIPQNKRCGYGVYICDLFGIGSSANMDTYCNIYNEALDHHARGVIFHPETMLARHLSHHGLSYDPGPFHIEFRYLGLWTDTNTGQTWDGGSPPDLFNKTYYSKFGRWE
jgi:hypothetical protein